jgi:eukaryotic-like serine/threonine-protein kinase
MTLIGKLLQSRYYLTEALGQGAFGHTYKAQDRSYRTNPLCVVKHLKPDNPDRAVLQIARNFFTKEADTLERLGRHSNLIPSLLDRFEEGGEFFIVQEWIDGNPLSHEVTIGNKLTQSATIELLKQILEPLVFCHGERVIHRDLKPENIMRRHADGKLVLIDFGAVKQLTRTTLLTQSQPTISIGTPGFMPGEQFHGRPSYASDVYAVGSIGIFAMTGIHPAQVECDPSTQEIEWQDKCNPTDAFAAVLTQMVKRLPIDRFRDASAALAALNSLCNSPSTPYPSSSLKTFSFETVRVDSNGTIIDRNLGSAQYLTENLGRGITLDMVFIPGGTFMMGSDESSDEQPIHPVTVPSFHIGKYPATQAQYQAIVGENPSFLRGADRPVEPVTWGDALAFCTKLSQKTGKKYTLPSESQWEYACRARMTTPFYFGETITPDLVNYDGNHPYRNAPKGKYLGETTPVGSFPPNAFGLYDLHGNVWEWCLDECHPNYVDAPTDGSAWTNKLTPDKNILRRCRGGSWSNYARNCRSASRFSHSATNRYLSYGFRVVLVEE